MFEESEAEEKRRPPSFWLKIAVVVAVAMIVINAFRVNPPRDVANRPVPVVEDTKGPVVEEPVAIEADDIAPFRMSFPYASTLKGSFRVREKGNRVLVILVDEANRKKYIEGGEYATLTATGRNPAGKINRKLEAGTYYLIFDNRGGSASLIVDAAFMVE